MRFVVRVARIVRGRGGVSGKGPQAKIVQRPANAKFIRRDNTGRGKNLSPPDGRAFRPARPATVRPAAFGSVRGLRYLCRMKTLLAALGAFALALGVIGIFVPLLPTTPFLLLAAALWVRSSPRLYGWLLSHRRLGGYIRDFREKRAIPLRAKVLSLGLMWASMLYCVFAVVDAWPWAQASLLAVAAGITWHILSFATLRR